MLPDPFTWRGDDLHAALPGGEVLFTTRVGAPDDRHANRERIAAMDGVPDRVLWGTQVHGTKVLRDGEPGAEADGQVTGRHGTAPLVFTADCLPIALVAGDGVAMLHGGWRGLADGIVAAGIRALRATGAVVAALGPSARGCCYEVGEEVHARFAGHDARRGERHVALDVVARDQLAACGVTTVHDAGLCTMCDGRFFSHRRDQATGRMGNLAWRT